MLQLCAFEGFVRRITLAPIPRPFSISPISLIHYALSHYCMQDPNLSQEDWSRFLPQFKKKTTSKRKKPHEVSVKKSYTPFPPAPTPSKIDLQLDSGEYFLNEQQREAKKKSEKRSAAKEKSLERKKLRDEEFEAPNEEEITEKKKKRKHVEEEVAVEEEVVEEHKIKKSKKKRA